MKIERDTVILSTGREFPAWGTLYFIDKEPVTPPLTPAERREIAEYMAARWRAWGRGNGDTIPDEYCPKCRAELERAEATHVALCLPCARLMECQNERAERHWRNLVIGPAASGDGANGEP